MSRYYPDGAADPTFAQAMADLADALGTTVTEKRIRIYARLLSDVPPERLWPAFVRTARDRVYPTFPTVGEIRRCVAPSEDDAGLLAWTRFDQAAREVGAWASLEVEDAAAAEALVTVFGSWPAYCDVDEGPALGMRRQEFLAAYRQARRQTHNQPGAAFECRRVLHGLCESDGDAAPPGATWMGYLHASGDVLISRRIDDGTRRPALPEGTDAAAAQGQEEA